MADTQRLTDVGNIIPGHAVVDFNFRVSPASTAEQLQQRLQACMLDRRILETLDAEPVV